MIRALSYLSRLANVRLILPTELFIRLVDGDKLHAGEQTKSGSRLTGYDLKHARAMEIARRFVSHIYRYLLGLGQELASVVSF